MGLKKKEEKCAGGTSTFQSIINERPQQIYHLLVAKSGSHIEYY